MERLHKIRTLTTRLKKPLKNGFLKVKLKALINFGRRALETHH